VHGLVIGAARGRHERYAARLRERAVARGIPVTFTGEQEDVREIFSLCEVILSLSGRPESFGRTVLEALSLGIPVVGYAHGGVGEILGRVFPAGRVPPGDVRAAADRVSGFLRERPRVPDVEAYPLSRMLERTLALYADLARVRLGSAAP